MDERRAPGSPASSESPESPARPPYWAALLAALRADEGLRCQPYQDTVGVWTVGYGHNLQAAPITVAAAEQILADDARDALAAARRYPWFDALDPVRQMVVVNMLFNLGPVRFARFQATLAALARSDYDAAAAQMLQSRWARQVGRRADRLAREMREGPPPVDAVPDP